MQQHLRRVLDWSSEQPLVVKYAIASGFVSVAALFRWLIDPFIGPYLYLTFLGAVVLCAALLDKGSSLFAIVLSAFAAIFLFTDPAFSLELGREDTLALFLFLAVALTSAGIVEGLRLLVHDLSVSARQKDALVSELHHRSRNNFQLLLALVAMQGVRARTEEARAVLRSLGDRIGGLGRLQELIYAPGTGDGIDTGALIDRLCGAFATSLLVHRPIAISCAAQSVTISRDLAAVIAIALNELVTNALKYAFPDGRSGAITIALRAEPGQLIVVVADDGAGCPVAPTHGTGLTLITTLLTPYKGEIAHEHAAPGCRVRLRIPFEP